MEALNKNEGYGLVAAPILNVFRSLIKEFGKSVLDDYCAASGQMVSVAKSSIFLAQIPRLS